MKCPTSVFSRLQYILKYIQVPYDNRYFVVYFKSEEVARMQASYVEPIRHMAFPWIDTDMEYKQYCAFLERVRKYDEWLDSQTNN